MQRGDFGAREVFFLLCLMVLVVALAWFITWAFSAAVIILASFGNLVAFTVWLMFQGI